MTAANETRKGEFPVLKQPSAFVRRRVIQYEDTLSVEAAGILGADDLVQEVYFDEIHFIYRFQKRDWGRLGPAFLGAVLVLAGLSFLLPETPATTLIGAALIALGGGVGIYNMVRLVAVPREIVRAVSPRGAVEFLGNRPRSRNPLRDAPRFFERLLTRVEVIQEMPLPTAASRPEPPAPTPFDEPPA